MDKIKITADVLLTILQSLLNDEDINTTITDSTAPIAWQNKTVKDILNVDYFTFRHRPLDTVQYVYKLEQNTKINPLLPNPRAYCLLSISSLIDAWGAYKDLQTVTVELEYWIQQDKVKILERMIDNLRTGTNGLHIPVNVNGQERLVALAVNNMITAAAPDDDIFNEMCVCNVNIDMVFSQKAYSRAEYTAYFALTNTDHITEWVQLPYDTLTITAAMTSKAQPKINHQQFTGSLNLSQSHTFTFTFDDLEQTLINELVKLLFNGATDEAGNIVDVDINNDYNFKLTRGDETFFFNCVGVSHTLTIPNDTNNATHTLVLTVQDGE